MEATVTWRLALRLKASSCRNVGWDKDDVWFAHCCMLDQDETKQFADNGIGIAHCPSSNQRLASGTMLMLESCQTLLEKVLGTTDLLCRLQGSRL